MIVLPTLGILYRLSLDTMMQTAWSASINQGIECKLACRDRRVKIPAKAFLRLYLSVSYV
jgi:hypothetical protein